MKLETRFSCGDKVWIFSGDWRNPRPTQATIGQVRVEVTDSKGINGGATITGCDIEFDNYKPQRSYQEVYMCDETGIGTGTLHILGKSIFATEQECLSACAARQEEAA